MIEQLREQLIRDEGLRLKPYKDSVGKLTIGVGRNLTDRGISRKEAMYLLENDIRDHAMELVVKLPWVASLDDARQAVLINMSFNLGVPQLLEFKVTLAAVQVRNFESAARHMLNSRWAKQVGSRALRLAEQMRTGVWQ